MKMRQFHSTVAFVFTLIAIVHLVRAINATQVTFGHTVIPVWVSWVAVLVAGYLAYNAYKLRS